MELHEATSTETSGKKGGTSGFIKPKYYSQQKSHVAAVCEKTTGYTLMDYADNVEAAILSNDYRTLYKHFYYVDKDGNLQDTDRVEKDAEGVDIEDDVNSDLTV
jgi:hypothetical protein